MEKHIKINQSYNIEFSIKREKQVGLSKALLKTFAIALLIGAAYGISIFILETNIVLFPIIGVLAVSYVYNSNCQMEYISIVVRALLGLICSLQILIGFLVCELLYSEMPLYPENIFLIMREYGRYILENPIDQLLPIFLIFICFIYGALQDYAFRFQKILMKFFIRKWGNYYYKKEGHILSIFMINPMKYDENDKNRLIAYITDGCYIEKHKNKVKAFYLPKNNIDEADINIQSGSITRMIDKEYYKIDLGSGGSCQKYEAPCCLIMDERQNVLVLEIEI